ncbi:MAG: carbohydrate kinase [Verrucomicrobiales bacterium]|nr:carbohydrate kinase [Verrucomicrobiales bacterium]
MKTNRNPKPTIAGIGEILWDLFPDGKRLGGAPTNFACHCHQLGAISYPVSCIGGDQLGQKTREQLEQLGIDAGFLQENSALETGRVVVSLNQQKKLTYQIIENVAWDHLLFTPDLKPLAHSLDAACFGILSQRSTTTRETIRKFLGEMPEGSLKILDVNLRKPYFSKELIEESLQLATILKLSDEELPVLADFFDLKGEVVEQLSSLRERFDLDLVAYTRGPDGSVLLDRDDYNECPGTPVEVVDSVGAGDAFTAALCTGLLQQWPLYEVNAFAGRVAAFVCANYGATPILPSFISEVAVD